MAYLQDATEKNIGTTVMITSNRGLVTYDYFWDKNVKKDNYFALVGSEVCPNREKNKIIELVRQSPLGVIVVSTSAKDSWF